MQPTTYDLFNLYYIKTSLSMSDAKCIAIWAERTNTIEAVRTIFLLWFLDTRGMGVSALCASLDAFVRATDPAEWRCVRAHVRVDDSDVAMVSQG